jgi:KaiC/GvpD/RAD55 family RecA-like ATPase
MDIVKSRSQKSFFSEHEFEIIKGEGIKVYPSLHTWSKKIEEVSPAVGQKTNFGIPNYFLQNINEPQHKVTNKRSTKKLQISSGITLLWGDPGTFKTWIGVNFLKPFITKDCFETDNAIFISFKISQPAVEYFRNQIFRYRTKENKKTKLGKKYKIKIFPATDPFESPASVFLRIKTQIDKLTANYPDDQPINKRFRAVVFGLHRLSQIPAYKNMEWEFLEVLVKYLKNKKILTLLIDWPDHIESQQENPPMAVDLCANVIKTKIESTTEQQNDGNSESKKLVKISIDRRDYHICNEAYYLKSDNREPF